MYKPGKKISAGPANYDLESTYLMTFGLTTTPDFHNPRNVTATFLLLFQEHSFALDQQQPS